MDTVNQAYSISIDQRVIRFNEFVPCKTAFIDARTPGSDKKDNFCLIGSGVAENPGQVTHIKIPHGFDVGGARQPRGCKNSHHSHDTEEVFIIFSGDWKFTWGQEGEDGEVKLSAGDVISIPTKVFRGFENIGADDGFMFSILGLDQNGTAGKVIWAPYVFQQAKSHGLVLLEDGRLIDTIAGEKVPDDSKEYTPISVEEASKEFLKLTLEDMDNCILRNEDLFSLPTGGVSHSNNVVERAVIGCENLSENMKQGKIAWEHGFHVRHLTIQPKASIPKHIRMEEEVIILKQGKLRVEIDEHCIIMSAGDVFTAPINKARSYQNNSNEVLEAYIVRRGNHPEAAQML